MNEHDIRVNFDWKNPNKLRIAGPDHNGDFAVRDYEPTGFHSKSGTPSYSAVDYVVYGSGGRDPVNSWGDWPPNPDAFGGRTIEDIEDTIYQDETLEHRLNVAWLDNSIQFPRLLAEIIGVGLTEQQWDDICATMDLDSNNLSELFDRAQAEWEKIKELQRDKSKT